MTLPQAIALFEYWEECPPENEMLATLAQVYTTWKPSTRSNMTEEQLREEHQKSLEARWKAGAMNVKQLFESMGGNFAHAPEHDPGDMPGVGRFPGT